MSTVDVVEAALRQQLLRGELAPGQRLRQDQIGAELGVSKIPVREAFQRLAGVGLLRFETNRGAFVPELTAAEADENYQLRLAIESLLLSQALSRLTIVDLAEAEHALTSSSTVTEANWAFHRALYRASGWQRGLIMAEMLHAAVAPYVLLYIGELGGAADSDAEHVALLDACRTRDEPAALALLDAHLRRAATALDRFLHSSSSASLQELDPAAKR